MLQALFYVSIVGPVISWNSHYLTYTSNHFQGAQISFNSKSARSPISILNKQRSIHHVFRFMTQEANINTEHESIQQSLKASFMDNLSKHAADGTEWASQFGLEDESGAIFYALFYAIRSTAKMGLRGHPFYISQEDIRSTVINFLSPKNQLSGFFTFEDLKQALEDDFLDANRGIANSKREAWKVSPCSRLNFRFLVLFLCYIFLGLFVLF